MEANTAALPKGKRFLSALGKFFQKYSYFFAKVGISLLTLALSIIALFFLLRMIPGDIVELARSENPADTLYFTHREPATLTYNEVVKKDTVVVYNGQRYHCYVAINPTKYKVIRKTFNDDGVVVTNVYYDNIIHLSIFQGTQKLYSRDFRKAMFADFVPERFLSQSVLTNMDYSSVDDEGFHFNVMLCIPDVASCYLLDANVSLAGEMSLEVKEY